MKQTTQLSWQDDRYFCVEPYTSNDTLQISFDEVTHLSSKSYEEIMGQHLNLEYSYDRQTWTSYTPGSVITTTTAVYWRGNNPKVNERTSDGIAHIWLRSRNNVKYKISGILRSIINKNLYNLNVNAPIFAREISTNQDWCGLFSNYSGALYESYLADASDLILDLKLTNYCYRELFHKCTRLEEGPVLPYMTLTEGCYEGMFDGCSNLTVAQVLPALNLVSRCYYMMFNKCTSLITAPSLPATNLAGSCYNSMFDGCSSLVNIPSLPATTLAEACYLDMFARCTNLESIPALPATALVSECYESMFYGCSKIKISDLRVGDYQNEFRIPTLGTGTMTGEYVLDGMFSNTGGTFTGTPTLNTTYYTLNTIVG